MFKKRKSRFSLLQLEVGEYYLQVRSFPLLSLQKIKKHTIQNNRISACITFLFLVTLRRILTWFNPEWDDLSRED